MLKAHDITRCFGRGVSIYELFAFKEVLGTIVGYDIVHGLWHVKVGQATVPLKRERFWFKERAASAPFSLRQIVSLAFGYGACDIEASMELIEFLGKPMRVMDAFDYYSYALFAEWDWLYEFSSADPKSLEYSIAKAELTRSNVLVIPERIHAWKNTESR